MSEQLVGALPGEVLGTLADIMLKLKNGGISPDELKQFAKRENPFEIVVVSAPKAAPTIQTIEELLDDWVNFYRNVFAEDLDLTSLRVPDRHEGFDRLIIVAKGMSPERVFQKMQEFFTCWKYTGNRSLDEVVFDADGVEKKRRRSDRETHAVWVRNRIEADQELKNQSANQLKECGIPGITLEARELYELKYFRETGKHLDISNWTLCAGSRRVGGHVPGMGWDGGDRRVEVYWFNPSHAFAYLRSREAVS
ncbi:MAG: hypothetical protein AAB584_01480 [Patescibacteria group bacterium]